MPASRLHLVRHGEVHNPDRILYGRLAGFHLSPAGREMAQAAADHVLGLGGTIREIRSSPLERAQESAAPFAEALGIDPVLDERIIEPTNVFEGKRMRRALRDPRNWHHLRRPSLPSWGEPYNAIVARMRAAMDESWHAVDTATGAAEEGDIVFVSHQAPIWMVHLSVAGLPLRHDPRTRRCTLSSVTTFERAGDVWREIGYAEPASGGIDLGAV
ncbi:histidine phosphatase family protein [Microbacterium sp.]|uniref:histidine phosphatase family protein n=1 Tax=Microbacterium sp. TaxID=51671 RepID=UPI0028119AA4|nr:histidine phosphatase family protein [Microbacterium sp.]